MEAEFPWMTYFVSLFVLVVLSIALSLLSPSRGRRYGPDASDEGAGQHRGSERAP
ncbi:hypothetical protein WJ542_03555 [Paraburkholderia sp. B3]|uniref:Ac45/VOA1 transmembrane domain-containing protein n=1 Tax=Paraburkholderia sp. B3 TaxID=3134791 RepID=UPI00398225CD